MQPRYAWSCDTGQHIPCFDSSHMIITQMFNICMPRLHAQVDLFPAVLLPCCAPSSWVVRCTHLQSMWLAILTMKKKGCMVFYFYACMWFHSYGCMVLCLTHLQAARALLLNLTASDHRLTILCVVKGPQGTQKLVVTAIQ